MKLINQLVLYKCNNKLINSYNYEDCKYIYIYEWKNECQMRQYEEIKKIMHVTTKYDL